ncbi:polysaccharide biosynthesis tyrosine autokinase [Limnoraphis robusta Tam1]|uniref:Polysaccharide biosynthesis tyrosine autokinase n=1 Tax=Limnoraphis robusta CCNP1315 TaxID=3110306 RepID=A0ABU5TXR3_9CYAN|nr:polysaccharide biosynthesis tyrosine autokinase [Limnoraphis robusta]MEA5497283.1 polysaccharide biosynthesis tyrosine autokinase [Limnoraphis robusta BA-68 BA1]MEA5519701.1 polysaccharide biosynthesis tyrosine autokinase [Limnoraphis robusta CCNP1315]MEA5540168.1 polysaccharide biosynthesis tyrosine autokinase [Limnoraphis robusta Tam1]MEA5544805.1 polysaccharide biosynthesis tyrosine autokinase [Limnoraphis robusta CCNP1324]
MIRVGRDSQSLPTAYTPPFEDDDEGGLDLSQLLGAIRRRFLIVIGLATVVASAAAYKAATDTPVYQAQFEILTEPLTIETQVISTTNPQTLSSREEIVAVNADAVKLKLLTSPQVLEPVAEKLQSQYPGISYEAIARGLNIRPSDLDILVVGYQSTDPQLVKAVLDLVAEAYLEYSLQVRQTDILKGIKFVEDQLPYLQDRVETQQERLQGLRQKYNLVDPGTTGQQLATQISSIEQQRLDTQLQLRQAQALYTNLQQQLANPSTTETASASVLAQSARYQAILSQLGAIDNEIAKGSVLYLEESPEIKLLQEQREQLVPLLRQEGEQVARDLANQIRELEARYEILTDTLNRLNQQVKQLSVTNREYADIQRELTIATENLNQFLAKREAFKIDAAQREQPWQLLTPAGSPKPSSASVKRNLLLGGVLGTLLGLGAALAIDKLSNILYTPKEIKDVARLPLLGIIPFDKNLKNQDTTVDIGRVFLRNTPDVLSLGMESKPQQLISVFYEAFRSLFTNIRLLSPDTPIRSVVISSAMPGEGKSTVAIYLAQAAAEQGRRVLLVDTDLRHPSIHNRLGLANMQGLTDVISTDIDFNHVIQQSPQENNLFVLTAGSIPPDPIRVLASQKMQDLIAQLRSAFDLVVYDAPPLTGLADAYLLAAETNGMVLVASLGQVKRSVLENALDQLKEHSNFSTPLLGVVANRAKNVPLTSYNYSYSSSSSYSQKPVAKNLNNKGELQKEASSPLTFFRKKSK